MVITTPSRHLIEWYRAELTSAAVAEMVATLEVACADRGHEDRVQLLLTMAVPSDEVLYVVFVASSSDLVVDLCTRAGLPPQRVTPDVDARIHTVQVG